MTTGPYGVPEIRPADQITELPNEPYFEGTGILEIPDKWGYPISIDGVPYLVDYHHDITRAQFTRKSVQLLNTQNQDSVGDVTSMPPEVWRRSAESWHLGAGQDRLDRKDSLPHRFEDSRHIDPWDQFAFRLLPETTMLRSLAAGHSFSMVVNNTYLFVGVGTTGWWYDSIGDIAPVAVTFGAALVSVASDGNELYVLLANGKVQHLVPNAVSGTDFATVALTDVNRGMIAYVKGFLIAGTQNYLWDISSGSPIEITHHHQTSWTWRSACDGLSVGYVLGGAGDKWTVSRLGLKQDATGFDPPIVAASMPDGEIGYVVASYLGYVLIGLSTGWRFGMPSGDGSITFGQLVSTDGPVECFEGQDRFVWYGLSEAGASPDASGLGRADLSNFTAPMTPAYAYDLDAGMTAGDPADPQQGRVRSVVTYGVGARDLGKRVFTIDGVGVFVQADTLCPEGYLTQGGMTFGTADAKRGLYTMVNTAPIQGGALDVRVKADSDLDWVQIGTLDLIGGVTTGVMGYTDSFHLADLQYRLERDADDHTIGPQVSRMEFRAIPIVGATTEWTIPIIMSEEIEWENSLSARSVWDDYTTLVGIVKDRRQFVYREGQHRFVLYGIDFEWYPTKLTRSGDTFQGVFTLIARELQ